MKTTVLVAGGANNLEIPCRLFPDMETGIKRCGEIFGVAGKQLSNGIVVWSYKEVDFDKYTDDVKRMSEVLFTKHYYGCGGPDRFVLKEVPFDEAFTCFDLD